MNVKKFTVFMLLLPGFLSAAIRTGSDERNVSFSAEYGFLSVLDHKVQFGKNGTYLNYVEDGGQDVLFPVARMSINAKVHRNTFVLLYQPLKLESRELIDRSITVDSLVFPSKTPVGFLYNFPFYRFSYLFELLPGNSRVKWGIGLSLQIRNATIEFESLDGTLFRTNRDVGLVPALKTSVRWDYADRLWLGSEMDGIYAPVSYLNGDDNDVTGAILDASVRAGYIISAPFTSFVNIRYLGGGAQGQSDNFEPPSDGYVKNWLHFLTVSIGFTWTPSF